MVKATGKAPRRPLPVIYPDTVRPVPILPGAESLMEMRLELSEPELNVVKMAMAIHSASRQPKLTWRGWRHIAVALTIGSREAKKAAKGRMDTPHYRAVMTNFLRATGLTFLNKDDRACAVRLLPEWDVIDSWRESLSYERQQALNNPREVHRAYLEDMRSIGDPQATSRPTKKRHHRQFPSLLEQYEALLEQLEMANERIGRAERESEYFAMLAQGVAEQAKISEADIARIREKVRAALAGEEPVEE